MLLGTTYVFKDEPCLGLYELNYQSPHSKGFHRYQIVLVIRDDKIAEYRKDLGRAKQFKGVDQFRIPGGVRGDKPIHWHTVGELMDIATDLRHGKTLFEKLELTTATKIKE